MEYIIKKYQVIYKSGNRDKVILAIPIKTKDIESVRIKLRMKHNTLGLVCKGINLEYEELNT